ncbi:MAG TPA: hypothetical protein ENI23_15995 [bacterium]|nr:hypothetical protein [bacterium]
MNEFIEDTVEGLINDMKDVLPRRKKLTVGFDVSGTILDVYGEPDLDIIRLINMFYYRFGAEIIIWSGAGEDVATFVANLFPFPIMTRKKGDIEVDLSFDDEEVNYGEVNVRVGPVLDKDYPCHSRPEEKWCDYDRSQGKVHHGGFMGHTCGNKL